MPSDNDNKAGGAAQKKARCPRCGAQYEYLSVSQHKPFPFCSPRCREIDLGNWVTGRYVVPGQSLPRSAAGDDPQDNPEEVGEGPDAT